MLSTPTVSLFPRYSETGSNTSSSYRSSMRYREPVSAGRTANRPTPYSTSTKTSSSEFSWRDIVTVRQL